MSDLDRLDVLASSKGNRHELAFDVPEGEDGMKYQLTFERIGRSMHGHVQEFTATDADDLAEQVWKLARRHLGSKMFDVLVDLEAGRGTIESGRFGRFTVEPKP